MALLSGVFSVSASAAELDTKPYHIYTTSYLVYGSTGSTNSRWDAYGTHLFYPGNGTIEKIEASLYFDNNAFNVYGFASNVIVHDIAYDDQTIMFEKGIKTTVKVENLWHRYLLICSACSSTSYYLNPRDVILSVGYTDGSVDYFSASWEVKNNSLNVKHTFTPSKDVQSISFTITSDVPLSSHNGHMSTVMGISYMGEYDGDNKHNLTIQQPSEEAGLLQGIWGELTSGFNALGDKLSGVWTAITDGFTNMGNKLTDVFNSIKELPSKIWGFIENGLKSLFVPSEEKIVDMKSQWEELLSSKYGAVWEVVQITFGSWENINANDQKNSISVPEVEIPLPNGQSFSFGGEEVQVVPSGFETIADICKMATGAFCTLMFINGLRKRYDEVMAVEQ